MATGGERIPRLYTRTGDGGTTGLAGGGRLDKDSPRVRAFGSYDELGSSLGLAEALLSTSLGPIRATVVRLQSEVFVVQAELSTAPGSPPTHRIGRTHVERLEQEIDRFDAQHAAAPGFVLPGGSPGAAALHLARTVARRAERELLALHRVEPQSPDLIAWANRLSDLLYALALATNHALSVAERPPDYSA